MADYHYLDPKKVKIKRRDGALLLKLDGQCLPLSPPRRAIPISAPDEFIVLSNEAGEELGIVRRLDDLEPCSRDLLADELERIYHATVIERVISIKRDTMLAITTWIVEVAAEGDEEPAILPDLKPILGVRLLKKPRVKAGAEAGQEVEVLGETTSGRQVTFEIAGHVDVQNARYPRIFITDTQGRRYEIPNCEELDLNSRRLGERYF